MEKVVAYLENSIKNVLLSFPRAVTNSLIFFSHAVGRHQLSEFSASVLVYASSAPLNLNNINGSG